jgi:hypothetical protein
LSNLDNCTFGVKDCDVFLGFIRPFYGSGVLEEGGLSITHIEFETAYERNIPRFILADIRFLNEKVKMDIPPLQWCEMKGK